MKVAMPRKAIRRLLWWSQAALFATAAGLLGYCAFVVADRWIYQRQADRAFDGQLRQSAPVPGPDATVMGGLVGRIEIPRLGLSVVIAEGTTAATLRRAAGHIEGTQLPGRAGNVGIAAHRDTPF
jgi:sortase A